MRLVTFEVGSQAHVGVWIDDAIADLTAADPAVATMIDVIRGGQDLASLAAGATTVPASAVRLLAPIPRPPKNVLAVGRNYHEHAREFSDSGFDASEQKSVPDHPIFFTKAPTSVIGPEQAIDTSNDPTGTTDYEGELGVVIGRPGLRIPRSEAMGHVFGYTVINDVTARDLQKRHVQWHVGKSPDTFCPMGPCLVTADEFGDIGAARLTTHVNGQLRQDALVAELIFDIPALIETVSGVMTLEPGDIIATGTPVGVGIGFDPPIYLQPGDVVEVAVTGIGTLRNPVI